VLKGYSLELPVFFDQESIDWASGRFDRAKLSYATKTALCDRFCSTIEANGFDAGIYSSTWWLNAQINGASLSSKYEIWVAQFANKCTYSGNYGIWQYSGGGWVSGIPVKVDINVRYNSSPIPKGTPELSYKLSGKNAVLSWTALNNVTGYTVFKKSDSGKDEVVKVLSNTLTYTVTPESSSDKYYVKAYKESGGLFYYGNASNTVTVKSDRVFNLKSTGYTQNSVSLTWDKVADCNGYRIYMLDSKTGKYLSKGTVTTNSFTVTGLDVGTSYSFKVHAFFNSNGSSEYVSTSSTLGAASEVLTQGTRTGKTYNLQVSSSSDTSLTLTWDNIKYKHDGYIVYTYDSTTGKYVKTADVGNKTKYTVKKLSPLTSNKFKVRAYYKVDGKTVYGVYSDILTASTKPSAVTNVKVSKRTQNSITFTWDKVSKCTGYRIYMLDKKTGKYLINGTVTTNSYTVTDLDIATDYSFKIYSYYNTDGSQKYVSGTSLLSPCKEIINQSTKTGKTYGVTVTATTDTKVSLKWDDIKYRHDGYFVYVYDESGKLVRRSTLSDVNSCNVTRLDSGKTYTFKIRAYFKNSNGTKFYGVYSAGVSAVTLPAKVTGVTVKNYTENKSLTLSWDKVANADGYEVYIKTGNDENLYKTVTGQSCTVTDLKVGSSYSFRVKAYRTVNNVKYTGNASAYKTITFEYAVPKNLKADSTYSETSTSVKWSATEGASGYEVYSYDYTNKKYVLYKTVSADTTSCVISGYDLNTTVRVRVRALYGSKKSAYSDYFDAYTMPSTPKNFKVSTYAQTTATLKWSKVKHADSYRVYIYDKSTKSYVKYKDVSDTSISLSGLSKGTTYKFKVSAINKVEGKSYFSTRTSAISFTTKK
jgi:fibronectin type 3 domain-containing protein